MNKKIYVSHYIACSFFLSLSFKIKPSKDAMEERKKKVVSTVVHLAYITI